MKFNFKDWKKVSEHKDHTIFKNSHGHELKIAHNSLHSSARDQMAALPLGGETPQKKTPKATSNSANWKSGLKSAPAKTDPPAKAYADGGEVSPEDEIIKINQAPQIPEALATTDAPQITPSEPTTSEPFSFAGMAPGLNPVAGLPDTATAVEDNAFAPPTPEGGAAEEEVPAQDQMAASAPPSGVPPTTPTEQPDTFGTKATSDTFGKGIEQQRQGIAGEAKAATVQADAELKALKAQAANQQQLQSNYKGSFDKLDQERQAFQRDISNSHIDPNHYLSSQSTGQRIATAIGLIIGGIGAGAGGQENLANKFLNTQIENDIAAQKADLGKKENLLSANMRQFGNLRDATDMTRVMQSDIIANQLKQAAAQATDPMAKARALKEFGALNAANADRIGQMAMRNTLLNGMKSGQVAPEHVVNMVVPEHDRAAANKELTEAQNMASVRDHTLSAFDQLTKVNTVANRLGSPIQSTKQIKALRGAALDKLTKDISGRVTPETVELIGGLFNTMGNDDKTNQVLRNQINGLLTQNAHFPILKHYGIDSNSMGRFDINGNPRIREQAPH